MQIQPYLFFEGRCEEAIEFYRGALGAEVLMMMRYKDSPEPPPPDKVAPGSDDKIMHAALRISDATLMMSDGFSSGNPRFDGFSLSLDAPDAATADRFFNALADGGRIDMPLMATFFAPLFGMVADRFGVQWMVTISVEGADQK